MAKRVVIGGDGAGNLKFRVSKPGRSADSGDLNDFLMHEAFLLGIPVLSASVSSLPIVMSYYQGNPALPTYSATLTVPHNLGFLPFIVSSGDSELVSVTFDGSNIYLTYTGNFTQTSGSVGLTSPILIFAYALAVQ
jgi:hypothetical protein